MPWRNQVNGKSTWPIQTMDLTMMMMTPATLTTKKDSLQVLKLYQKISKETGTQILC